MLSTLGKIITEPWRLKALVRRYWVHTQVMVEGICLSLASRPRVEQTILLAGSGRSGTTWIADVISTAKGVQQIFEPLYPLAMPEVTRITGWKAYENDSRSCFLRPGEPHEKWHQFLHQVLTGNVRNTWTDSSRTSWRPSRYLVKAIRMNMMLGYIYDSFKPKIIFVTRHPCAVVCSQVKKATPAWTADIDCLLDQADLVRDYLLPHAETMLAAKSDIERQAILWAVENAVALDQLKNRPHLSIRFEDLCLDPISCYCKILSWLELEVKSSIYKKISSPSRTSFTNYDSALQRLHSWEKHLTSAEAQTIIDWSQRLGISLYDLDILPTENTSKRA